MGIIGSSLAMMIGMIGGVYIAQKYEVPNIRNMVETTVCKAKVVEETYRNPTPPPHANTGRQKRPTGNPTPPLQVNTWKNDVTFSTV